MRRLLLFAALLTLLGLSTAVAASFSAQSEDVTSFTTDVSISVPTIPPTRLDPIVYIVGSGTGAVGELLRTTPPNNFTTDRLIKLDAAAVQPQTDTTKHFTWTSASAPPGGYLLQGTVTLYLSQDGPGSNKMTAGLFDCDEDAAPDSADTTLCDLITSAEADALTGGGSGSTGYKDRVVHFGAVGTVVIDEDRQLRLKVVNQSPASAADWRLQWGYNPARPSALEITP